MRKPFLALFLLGVIFCMGSAGASTSTLEADVNPAPSVATDAQGNSAASAPAATTPASNGSAATTSAGSDPEKTKDELDAISPVGDETSTDASPAPAAATPPAAGSELAAVKKEDVTPKEAAGAASTSAADASAATAPAAGSELTAVEKEDLTPKEAAANADKKKAGDELTKAQTAEKTAKETREADDKAIKDIKSHHPLSEEEEQKLKELEAKRSEDLKAEKKAMADAKKANEVFAKADKAAVSATQAGTKFREARDAANEADKAIATKKSEVAAADAELDSLRKATPPDTASIAEAEKKDKKVREALVKEEANSKKLHADAEKFSAKTETASSLAAKDQQAASDADDALSTASAAHNSAQDDVLDDQQALANETDPAKRAQLQAKLRQDQAREKSTAADLEKAQTTSLNAQAKADKALRATETEAQTNERLANEATNNQAAAQTAQEKAQEDQQNAQSNFEDAQQQVKNAKSPEETTIAQANLNVAQSRLDLTNQRLGSANSRLSSATEMAQSAQGKAWTQSKIIETKITSVSSQLDSLQKQRVSAESALWDAKKRMALVIKGSPEYIKEERQARTARRKIQQLSSKISERKSVLAQVMADQVVAQENEGAYKKAQMAVKAAKEAQKKTKEQVNEAQLALNEAKKGTNQRMVSEAEEALIKAKSENAQALLNLAIAKKKVHESLSKTQTLIEKKRTRLEQNQKKLESLLIHRQEVKVKLGIVIKNQKEAESEEKKKEFVGPISTHIIELGGLNVEISKLEATIEKETEALTAASLGGPAGATKDKEQSDLEKQLADVEAQGGAAGRSVEDTLTGADATVANVTEGQERRDEPYIFDSEDVGKDRGRRPYRRDPFSDNGGEGVDFGASPGSSTIPNFAVPAGSAVPTFAQNNGSSVNFASPANKKLLPWDAKSRRLPSFGNSQGVFNVGGTSQPVSFGQGGAAPNPFAPKEALSQGGGMVTLPTGPVEVPSLASPTLTKVGITDHVAELSPPAVTDEKREALRQARAALVRSEAAFKAANRTENVRAILAADLKRQIARDVYYEAQNNASPIGVPETEADGWWNGYGVDINNPQMDIDAGGVFKAPPKISEHVENFIVADENFLKRTYQETLRGGTKVLIDSLGAVAKSGLSKAFAASSAA